MKEIKIIYIGLYFLIATSCLNNQTTITLETKNDTLNYVQIQTDSTIDQWELPYPVYQFQIGDIDQDGIDDILVGVIKTTRFDSALNKRLFIFKNYHGLVRPLWLGSKLGHELQDFKFIKDREGARIRSIEREISGKYLIAEYKWNKFGLQFTKYIKREIILDDALKLLNY